jgi:mRNA-degrading endonuclease RelE of RelBE toxin-antitoxin system
MIIEFHNDLLRILKKLSKKDLTLYLQILNKIDEIKNASNINNYKNLKIPLYKFKRVYITTRFVLIFEYIKSEDLIIFRYFDHRKNIYKKNYG